MILQDKTVRLHLFFFFFFFFFNFGLTRPFRPIQADTDRVGPIWAASAPISAASARFGNRYVARRDTDTRSAASLPRRRVPPCRTRVRWPGSRVRASQRPIDYIYDKNQYTRNITAYSLGYPLQVSVLNPDNESMEHHAQNF